MENIYRREYVHRRKTDNKVNSEKYSFKGTMAKQSMICLIILLVSISIWFSPDKEMEFAKNAVEFMLSSETDFKDIPDKIREFMDNYILDKDEKKSGKDVLLKMICPLEGKVESPFGMRVHPIENVEKFHYGIDISAALGTDIKCAEKGIAKEVSQNDEYGKYIVVDHGEEIYTLYAHCSEIIAQQGDEIQNGQTIAKVGDTGITTGAHLHFEMRDGDEWLDPADFIDFR